MTEIRTDSTTASVPFGRQLGETARAARGLLIDVLTRDSATFESWVVLNTLATRGQAIDADALQRELAEGLETDALTISRLLAQVEDAGLIHALAAPGELDSTRFELTEQGEVRHRHLRESVERTTALVVSGLNPDDLHTTIRVLGQVNDRVTALRAG